MMKNKFLSATLILITLFTFQSCHCDDDGPDYDRVALVTVKQDTNKHLYFVLESSQKTLYPETDKNTIGYEVKDGQRALIYFDLEDEKTNGYDYTIELKYINNVLTKDVINLTDENKEEIGDDGIRPIDISLSGNYLNIDFLMPVGGVDKHLVNLVVNTLATDNTDTDYTSLEFHQNKNKDVDGPLGRALVSFNLKDLAPSITKKKGIKIRIKDLSGKETSYKLDYNPQKTERFVEKSQYSNLQNIK